jgi:hypothetical protein
MIVVIIVAGTLYVDMTDRVRRLAARRSGWA